MKPLQVEYKNERFHPPVGPSETFEQQYSPLYSLRIRQLKPILLTRMKIEWGISEETVLPKILGLINALPEEGQVSSEKYVVGCIYKDTPIRPSFLKDYTKFVIPSSLEVEAREDGDLAEVMTELDEKLTFEDAEKDLAEAIMQRGLESSFPKTGPESQTTVEAYKYLTKLHRKEKLWFEDESGRVEVDNLAKVFTDSSGINSLEVVSGMVIAAEGRLNHHTGKFAISRWMMTGLNDLRCEEARHSEVLSGKKESDRYVAFLSTLDCEGASLTDGSETKHMKKGPNIPMTSSFYRNKLSSLFKSNSLPSNQDNSLPPVKAICEKVKYFVICGGLVPDLDEVGSGSENKLSAFEVAQRKSQIRLDSEETTSKRETTALNMQEADKFLSHLIDENELSEPCDRRLCVMPSQREPSNHFYPQQPLYSFCFPKTAGKRMGNPDKCWKVDLATNPNHISIQKSSAAGEYMATEVTIIGTSGENIRDCMRYSHNLISEIDWIERTLLCRHICPTAPDTLPCFPYRVKGTKRFGQSHLSSNTSEEGVGSDPFCLLKETMGNGKAAPDVLFAGACEKFSTRYLPAVKRRLIAVPKFSKTHSFCVMNIDSPTLETFEIRLDEGGTSTEAESVK